MIAKEIYPTMPFKEETVYCSHNCVYYADYPINLFYFDEELKFQLNPSIIKSVDEKFFMPP